MTCNPSGGRPATPGRNHQHVPFAKLFRLDPEQIWVTGCNRYWGWQTFFTLLYVLILSHNSGQNMESNMQHQWQTPHGQEHVCDQPLFALGHLGSNQFEQPVEKGNSAQPGNPILANADMNSTAPQLQWKSTFKKHQNWKNSFCPREWAYRNSNFTLSKGVFRHILHPRYREENDALLGLMFFAYATYPGHLGTCHKQRPRKSLPRRIYESTVESIWQWIGF